MTGPEREPGALARCWAGFVDALGALGSVGIAALMLLICADVAGRNLFDRPIPAVAEIAALAVVVITFLQLASAVRHERMAQAEIFIAPLLARRPRGGRALAGLYDLLGALACGLIALATWPTIAKDLAVGEFIGVQGVMTLPTWPFRCLILLGAATAALHYLVRALAAFRAALAGRRR